MDTLKPPDALELRGNIAEKWRRWKQAWTLYAKASGAVTKPEDVQCAIFLHVIGKDAIEVYNTMTIPPGDQDKIAPLIAKFEDYCSPKKNVTFERFKFNSRSQKETENVDQFATELKTMAKNCNYGDLEDGLVRDQIVFGIMDNVLRGRLLREAAQAELSLNKTLDLCRAHEASNAQLKVVSSSNNVTSHVEEVRRKPRRDRTDKTANSERSRSDRSTLCGQCGYKSHGDGQCPAKGKECHICKKKGHFAARCRKKTVREVKVGDHDADMERQDVFLGAVDASVNDSVPPWNIDLKVNGHMMNFKIDCGADINVISEHTWRGLSHRPKLKPASIKIDSPGGPLQCTGQFVARVQRKGIFNLRMYVVKQENVGNLLSRGSAVRMNLIARLDAVQTQSVKVLDEDDVYGELGVLRNRTVRLCLRDDAVPYSASTARHISIPQMPKVRTELERMQKLGVITKVTEPTDWCQHMVVVPKSNGQLRICVDMKPLNKAIRRERYMLPTIDDILHRLTGAQVFSSLDASSGYWQLLLEEGSSKFTTFITPFGRYRFLRLPFGVSSASEIFQREMSDMLQDLPGVAVYQDDIIVYGRSMQEHDDNLRAVFEEVKKSGMKLNKSKCKIRQNSLEFLGHRISSDGVSPDDDKVKAITEMEQPTDVKSLRRVLGMINYLGRYLKDLAEITKPLYDLLRKDTAWMWGQAQEAAFKNIKQLVSTAPVLAYFDIDKPTYISADASQYGLGAVLFQDNVDGKRPVAYCSRTLTAAEMRYAQIEKECLAITWGCEKFYKYVRGLENFTVYTDHKPLVPLINSRNIDSAPLRCQRLLLRLGRYNANAVYVPGKDLIVADTLSRAPIRVHGTPDTVPDVVAYVQAIGASLPMSDPMLRKVVKATDEDVVLQEAIAYTRDGWPRHVSSVHTEIQQLYSVRGELSVVGGLLVRGSRIVVPKSMQNEVLNKLHDGHLGLVKCRERAQQSIWWPGVAQDIAVIVKNCEHCQRQRNAQPHEPLKPTPIPERPWQKIGADLCTFGTKQYLVVIDYYSRYLELAYMSSTTTAAVIAKLKNMFARWGICEELMSDNGPQFVSSEFANFASDYGFLHPTSSPYFSQSNGMAERGVQLAKNILKQVDVHLALMIYRDTPIAATGYSPNELMLARQVRTTLPVLPCNLKPHWPKPAEVKHNDDHAKDLMAKHYNRRHGVHELPPLTPGEHVRIRADKQWGPIGTVQYEAEEPRSYVIQTDEGVYRRNRQQLLTVPEPVPVPEPAGADTTNESPSVDQNDKIPPRRSGRIIKAPDRLNL